MPYIAPEVVQEAKRMDLLTYLKNYEPYELVHFSGNTYTTKTHDSLKISNGKWMWWSRGIGGRSAVDYLIKVRGYTFMEAVQTIAGQAAISPPVSLPAEKTSQIPVIMLTALEDEYTQVSSFDCLADDYMTKPFSMVVLGKRITALLRRAGVKDEPKIWKYGELTVDFSGYSACSQNGKIDITPKEIELLKLLLDHKGLVLSRSQILNAVWGDDSYVIDRIVDSYIRNLRKKLELDCIVTVKGIGYKLEVGA